MYIQCMHTHNTYMYTYTWSTMYISEVLTHIQMLTSHNYIHASILGSGVHTILHTHNQA